MRHSKRLILVFTLVLCFIGADFLQAAPGLAQEPPATGALQASIVEEISLVPVAAFSWSLTGDTWSNSGSGTWGILALINIPAGTYSLSIQPAPYAVPATVSSISIQANTTSQITLEIDMGPDELQTAPWIDISVPAPVGSSSEDDGYIYTALNQTTGISFSEYSEWGVSRLEDVPKGSYEIWILVDTDLYHEPEPVMLAVEGAQTYTVPFTVTPLVTPDPIIASLTGSVIDNPASIQVGQTATFQFDLLSTEAAISDSEIEIFATNGDAPLTTCTYATITAGVAASCTYVVTAEPDDAGTEISLFARATYAESPTPIDSAPVTLVVDPLLGSDPVQPSVELNKTRSDPGSSVDFALVGFPAESTVTITWLTQYGVQVDLGTTQTDAAGESTGSISVPAAPGGTGHTITFASGSVQTTAAYEIAARISPSTDWVRSGDTITLNLRGFARFDAVTIRWKNGSGAFVPVTSATTSSTGSVTNLPVTIPSWAPEGLNTIRVDGIISQQSTRVTVMSPSVVLGGSTGIVGSTLTFSGTNFASNVTVSMTWVRLSGSPINLGEIQTDSAGAFNGSIVVPATPGGPGQTISFSAPGATVETSFEVIPRIVTVGPTPQRGATTDLSLRGFARKEAVTVEWWNSQTSQWVVVASGETSNTGSANILFTVPIFAFDGIHSVRVSTATFTLQLDDVPVSGGWEY